MKNLFSKLLLCCAVAFCAACSSSDDEASNPVSNPVFPSVAKIGSECTIQGNGFASGQTLLLQPAGETAIDANARFTVNGATFTVPYTLGVGTVSVILVADGNQWPLGTLAVTAGDNPVSALSLPSEMALGEDVTVGGIGFESGDVLVFTSEGASVMVNGTPATDGLKVSLGSSLAEGDYAVSLQRGKSVWELSDVYVYQPRRIESITISDHAYLSVYGLENLVLAFSYNDDGTLKSIDGSPLLAYEFAYSGNTISVDNYTYKLDDQKRIVSHTGMDPYTGGTLEYEWSYDAEGHLVSIKQKGSEDNADGNLTQAYANGNLSKYTFSMANEYLHNSKAIRLCPNTPEPAYLVNAFAWLMSKDDFFLGFLLNNAKTSTFVTDTWFAGDIDWETGEDTFNEFSLAPSYEANVLTLTTNGVYTSSAQGFFGNKVAVKYANK